MIAVGVGLFLLVALVALAYRGVILRRERRAMEEETARAAEAKRDAGLQANADFTGWY